MQPPNLSGLPLSSLLGPPGEVQDMPCHPRPAGSSGDEGGEQATHTMQMVATDEGDAVMIMGGMPPWLFVAAAVLVLILSFVLVERIGGGGPPKLVSASI